MTQGRKPYKKSLKVRHRTRTRTRTRPTARTRGRPTARTRGRTRKLRTQRRSHKHKKYPKKKYLGGLRAIRQETGNCHAHAIARCIYRICKDYRVMIPGTDKETPKTPTDKSEFDKQIEDDQLLVYFTLLPIVTYFIYILRPDMNVNFDPLDTDKFVDHLSTLGTNEDALFNKEFTITDDDKNKIVRSKNYFKQFNKEIINRSINYDKEFLDQHFHNVEINRDPEFVQKTNEHQQKKLEENAKINQYLDDNAQTNKLLTKQLAEFNALTKNLREALQGKLIHYKQYSVDDYMNTEKKKYGIYSHGKHAYTITNVENIDDEQVKIVFKNTLQNHTEYKEIQGVLMKTTAKTGDGTDGHEAIDRNKNLIEDIDEKRKNIRNIIDNARSKILKENVSSVSIVNDDNMDSYVQIHKKLKAIREDLDYLNIGYPKILEEYKGMSDALKELLEEEPPKEPKSLDEIKKELNTLKEKFNKEFKQNLQFEDLINTVPQIEEFENAFKKLLSEDNSPSASDINKFQNEVYDQFYEYYYKESPQNNDIIRLYAFTVEDQPQPSDNP